MSNDGEQTKKYENKINKSKKLDKIGGIDGMRQGGQGKKMKILEKVKLINSKHYFQEKISPRKKSEKNTFLG